MFDYRLQSNQRAKQTIPQEIFMKKLLSQLTITLGLGVACGFSLAAPGLAQYQQIPEDSNYQSNEQDSLYGNSTLGVNPMDLIHNYNLSVGRSAAEFSQESQMQIQDSAAEFKRLQQEQMLQQYNTTPQSVDNSGQ